jgi:hypothetical protein
LARRASAKSSRCERIGLRSHAAILSDFSSTSPAVTVGDPPEPVGAEPGERFLEVGRGQPAMDGPGGHPAVAAVVWTLRPCASNSATIPCRGVKASFRAPLSTIVGVGGVV